MEVYLMRHGEAGAGADDAARLLTDRGREQVHRVARHAAALQLQVAAVRHSGLARARETAEILAKELSPPRGVREMPGLRPGDDPGEAKAVVVAAREPLVIVGHLPHLGRLAASLLVDDPGKGIIQFSEAALTCLAREKGTWSLLWLLTPDLARAS